MERIAYSQGAWMCTHGRGIGEPKRPRNVRNEVAGYVAGPSVQVGEVHGGIHVHHQGTERAPVPYQNPPSAGPLAGRERILAELDAVLGQGTTQRGPAVISGPGGVGKTALALAWCHRQTGQFPDGQLYADLLGDTPGNAISATEVLALFLRSLDVAPERIPASSAERVALYRSLTSGRSMAILLDNAATPQQVRPLLPTATTCAAIVTSRSRLTGLAMDGARLIELDALAPDAALRMLSHVLGADRVNAEEADARALIRLCSGLPLALAISGARLAAHPRWPISRLVSELSDEQRRLSALAVGSDTSVQAVLDNSYHGLPEHAARLYRLLAWHPGEDFPLGLVTEVARADDVDVDTALEELIEVNLLREIAADRYRYHDLVRLHARQASEQHDTEQERAAAVRRMVHWYLVRAVEADLVVLPHRWQLGPEYDRANRDFPAFASSAAALDWFDSHRANLLSALRIAAARRWDEFAWQLCEAFRGYFLYRKHYDTWLASHRLGLESAARLGNPLAECRMRCQLGFMHLELSNFDDADRVTLPALELAKREGDLQSVSTVLQQLGMAAQGRGEREQALHYLQESCDMAREARDQRSVALRLRRMGTLLSELGQHDEAIEHLRESTDILAALGDIRTAARSLTYLGEVCVQMGAMERAERILNEALAVMRTSGSPTYQAQILEKLGEIAESRGDLGVSYDQLSQALELYRESGSPYEDRVAQRLAKLSQPPQRWQGELPDVSK